MNLGVTLVATLLNEERALPRFLDSILAQTRAPNEVILVDGGSRDRSCEIIRKFIEKGARFELIEEAGTNRSKGRNIGIKCASQGVIAVSDVGCRLQEDWLEKIVKPIETGEAEVAAGYYAADAFTIFERAVAAATLPTPREVAPKTFLPSSRSVAFTKSAWEKAGGYPEKMSEAEDTYFDLALKHSGARFSFVPEALVYWRQQEWFDGLFRQFLHYAKSDGQAGHFFGHYRKTVFLVSWKLLVLLLFILALFFSREMIVWPIGLLILTWLSYSARYIARSRKRGWDWGAALLSPVIMAVVDTANFFGYLAGRSKRKKP